MSTIKDAILNRRSIRHFADRPVAREALEQVLEAVRWAPSWANTQCWEVVVVTDPAVKARRRGALPPKGNPAADAVEHAPVVMVMCAQSGSSGYYKGEVTTKFGDWMLFDLGLATQNLCLMAHALGLGTVVVGLFDHRKAAEALHLPDGYELVALVPLGYPAKIGGAPKRREISEFTHSDAW